ncbi:MAG: TrkA family potassium uptake protein [Desulfobulbaceae bacterium]|nr:TrkA family potassium uptake protein [Desulfobulbaceae bacterium]
MRIVFIDTSTISVATAENLLAAGHEVVFIEIDKEKIGLLSDKLDCGFMHGDGTSPSLLREIGPENTHFLFCLTENDRDNIIAALVGRSLGFPRVIVKIEDRDLEHICTELGLDDIIVPTRTISRYLADMVGGQDVSELTTAIKGEARFFSFIVTEAERGNIKDINLPKHARIICYYRDGNFTLSDGENELKIGDEVVVLTYRVKLDELKQRWPGSVSQNKTEEKKLKEKKS